MLFQRPVLLTWALVLLARNPGARGEGFLGGRGSKHPAVSAKTRSDELQAAMGAVLGCGGGAARGSNRSAAIARIVQPIWRSLPKTESDRVEWRQLRYIAHRYFMQTSSVIIRGLEPVRQLNSSHHGAAEVLSQQVPGLVEMMLDGHTTMHGFSFEDALIMVETLEQLVFNSETSLLESVYAENHLDAQHALEATDLHNVLEDYMIHWMMGEDQESIKLLMEQPDLREQSLPHWSQISSMVDGTIKSMEFEQLHRRGEGSARIAMTGKYSFDDAHEIIASIGRSFASFWESECQMIKSNLVEMDRRGTGRVRLADFYGANLDGEWRFGESEAYLRELGALDESSKWHGKQLIIPNYLQGTSNCIVTRPNYLVCCVNECEAILGEIEAAVGAPVAEPEDILRILRNMTGYEDEPVRLDKALQKQLQGIAGTHGGKVPVHGRLFSQWLHYAFPRECPFPHKAGESALQTPTQFGERSLATQAEMERHKMEAESKLARQQGQGGGGLEGTDDAQWMSQWSEDEELLGDYSAHVRAPWQGRHAMALGGAAALAAALVWAGVKGSSHGGGLGHGGHFETKSHFV